MNPAEAEPAPAATAESAAPAASGIIAPVFDILTFSAWCPLHAEQRSKRNATIVKLLALSKRPKEELLHLRESYVNHVFLKVVQIGIFIVCVFVPLRAQETTPPVVPPVVPPPTDNPGPPADRVFGVLPNYRTADGTIPFRPITAKRKLTIAMKDSFDYPNYFVAIAFTGIYQLEHQNPGFGQGVKGFAHTYATSYADQVIGNLLTEGVLPAAFHQDPRYFRKVNGSFISRASYALSRVIICKTDHGNLTFNVSEVLGNSISASIGNAYYPDNRGFNDTVSRAGTAIATDAISNVLKEFWPDIKRKFLKKRSSAPDQ